MLAYGLLLLSLKKLAGSAFVAPLAGYSQISFETGGHVGGVTSLAYSDNKTLVSCGWDKTIRVWNGESGRSSVIRYSSGPALEGIGQQVCPCGDGLVAVSLFSKDSDAEVLLINTKLAGTNQNPIKARRSFTPGELALAFNPQSNFLAVGGGDGVIHLIHPDDLTDSAPVLTQPEFSNGAFGISLIAFSKKGDRLAIYCHPRSTRFGGISVSDLRGRSAQEVPVNVRDSAIITWSGTGQLIFSNDKGRLHSWDPDSPETPPVLINHNGIATSCAFSASGEAGMAICGGEIWMLHGRSASPGFKLSEPALSCVLSPNGHSAAFILDDGTIAFAPYDGGNVNLLKGNASSIHGLRWFGHGRGLCWSHSESGPITSAIDLRNLVTVSAEDLIVDDVPNANPHVEVRDNKLYADGVLRNSLGDVARDKILSASSFAGAPLISTLAQTYRVDGLKEATTYLVGHRGFVETMCVSPDGSLLATGGIDGAIRIWSKKQVEVGGDVSALLTIFMGDDGQWIAWNDKTCFYTCSAKGDEFLGIQTNRGLDEPANFLPAYACRDQYKRDDIIRSSIRLLDFGTALSSAGISVAATPMAKAVSSLCEILPESLTLEHAEKQPDGTWVAHSQLSAIKCKLTNVDGRQTVLIRNAVPGKELGKQDEKLQPDEIVKPVILRHGRQELLLTPKNSIGEGQTIRLGVTFDEVNSAAERTHTPGTKRVFHVLCVGAGHYDDSKIDPLNGPEKDAADIDAFYRSQDNAKGIGKVESQVIAGPSATKEKIEDALTALEQPGVVNPDDTVLIYMSGHGFTESAEDQHVRCYFAPTNAKHDQLSHTCLDWDVILVGLRRLQSVNVILVVDQCHSGAIADTLSAHRDLDSKLYSLRQEPVLIFASCSSKGISVDGKTNSVFTGEILRALKDPKNADPGTSLISLLRLYAGARSAIKKLSKDFGYMQDPDVYGGSPGQLDEISMAYCKG